MLVIFQKLSPTDFHQHSPTPVAGGFLGFSVSDSVTQLLSVSRGPSPRGDSARP